MSAAALIEQLHTYGIRLVAANDGVNLRVSGKPLTPDLRQQVLKHKTELLAYLAAKPAANDPTLQDWQAADQAYQLHACHCPQCRAAGRGHGQRCEEGTVIWRVYQNAPIPTCRSISHAKPAPVPPPDLALLLQAAMLACDHWGDGKDAREAMRQDCLNTPADKRKELAAYFQQMYGGKLQ